MFRRKDNDPVSPTALAEKPSEPSPRNETRPQPELPRRQVDLPTAPTPATASDRPAGRVAAPEEGKRLIVGPGIRLSGEITACDRLIVEGTVEVTLNETRALEIAEAGRFTGGCEVEEAEISGVYEGELTVRRRLLIRSTGRVKGTVRYGEIEIERGGQLTGSVAILEGAE